MTKGDKEKETLDKLVKAMSKLITPKEEKQGEIKKGGEK